jgi:hypothetical protein
MMPPQSGTRLALFADDTYIYMQAIAKVSQLEHYSEALQQLRRGVIAGISKLTKIEPRLYTSHVELSQSTITSL